MTDTINSFDGRINELSALIKRGGVVFFGGAGVSTESGIPDFRSAGGIYSGSEGGVSPETIISHAYFMSHTKEFFDYYRKAFIYPDAKPNAAHLALAEFERQGYVKAVVTQNVDALHTRAGSRRVYELHGCVERNYCLKCGRKYPLEAITETAGVPLCECGGVIKPDVVLYEEQLDSATVTGAVRAIMAARTLIVGGTSLAVYPAAGFLQYFRGGDIVLINKSETPLDSQASLIFREGIAEVFAALMASIQ